MEEIRMLKESGVNYFYFIDETFNMPNESVLGLLEELKKLYNLDVFFLHLLYTKIFTQTQAFTDFETKRNELRFKIKRHKMYSYT